MAAISVTGLSKAYKQYKYRWSRLLEWVWPGRRVFHQPHWVLKDIAFEVQQGEALGIIGINGAGKSTLLKIITGTTQPTTGKVELQGRVAALLELGMGFHPSFTGRENVYMAGQLLGMSTQDIHQLMPSIESFAEIGDYIDMPVRVYSSGMQMRLAFSVATATRPDVLIVDEAMSVGDAYFQHKSFERISQFQKDGTTLLLVSHDKAAIQSICNRAILLRNGSIAYQGKPEQVMNHYNAMLAENANANANANANVIPSSAPLPASQSPNAQQSGSGEVRIQSLQLTHHLGQQVDVLRSGESASLCLKAEVMRPVAELVMGLMIKDRLGQVVFGTNTFHSQQVVRHLKQGQQIEFKFDFVAHLGPGHYSVTVALHAGVNHVQSNYDWRDLALVFEVINVDKAEFVGVTWLPHTLRISHE